MFLHQFHEFRAAMGIDVKLVIDGGQADDEFVHGVIAVHLG